jgi:hypothetical protein
MDAVGANAALESDEGHLVVTDQRFAFVGEHSRDFWVALVERVRHLAHDRTMVKLWDNETWSGFAYDDAEITRLYLDLVMAGKTGTREAYLAGLGQGLRDHEMRRPMPPASV